MSMSEKKKALLIGNNEYKYVNKLNGCVNDVEIIGKLLERNDDGQKNFSIWVEHNISNSEMQSTIENFLKRPSEHGLIYFSGHGCVTEQGGFICGTDARREQIGVSMTWLSEVIHKSTISQITLIFDCCHAGEMFNLADETKDFSLIRKGVSLLAATNRDDTAAEYLNRGIFSTILEEGLKGASADIFGNITIADLYSTAQNMLSPFQQRPVFKSVTDNISPIRTCNPLIDLTTLRKLNSSQFFPELTTKINVNSDILHKKKADFDIDYETYLTLFAFEKAGLISCEKKSSLIEETLEWGSCHLSTYGKHVWNLIKNNRI